MESLPTSRRWVGHSPPDVASSRGAASAKPCPQQGLRSLWHVSKRCPALRCFQVECARFPESSRASAPTRKITQWTVTDFEAAEQRAWEWKQFQH
jgi:hypothetical protein